MANLYSTAPYKGRPDKPDMIRLMAQSEKEHDWECLKPYPSLLLWYQSKHQSQVREIARWVSHFRMPFLKPDYQEHVVNIVGGKNQPSRQITFITGRRSYGHNLCKQNCEKNDYITGDIIAPALI